MADKVYPVEDPALTAPAPSSTAQKQKQSSPPPPHVNVDVVYKTPLPLPPNHPSNRRRQSRSCCCCCLIWLISLLVTIAIILGITALVLYLVLQPKLPTYSIKDTANTQFNLSSSFLLTSQMDITVEANNPNKKIGIYYDQIQTTLFYDDSAIASGSAPAFYQGHQNTTLFAIAVSGQDTPLTSAVGSALKTILDNDNDNLSMEADTVVKARVKIGGWKSHALKIKVECTLLINSPSSSSSPTVFSQDCKAKLASLWA